ncbi:DUF3606 domain-containing protein [Bosea sp. RAF48]
MRYWNDKFGVSKARLYDAVPAAGSSAEAVERELRRNKLGGENRQ